jgi:thiosulfate reductase cytochrome b subunit
MKSYQEIKEEELIITENYSNKKLDRYIWLSKTLRKFFNENFLWSISIIPYAVIPSIFVYLGFFKWEPVTIFLFVLVHFLYWTIKGKKDTRKFIEENLPELDISIEVLEDIRKERNKYG